MSILSEYIEEESNELVLRLRDIIEKDGFIDEAAPSHSHETISLKILAMTEMKVLAILGEKIGQENLMGLFMKMLNMHIALMKSYLITQIRKQEKKTNRPK